MKFRKINESTINCIITQDDLKKHGITEIFERTSLAAAKYAMLNSRYAADRSASYSLYYTMQ